MVQKVSQQKEQENYESIKSTLNALLEDVNEEEEDDRSPTTGFNRSNDNSNSNESSSSEDSSASGSPSMRTIRNKKKKKLTKTNAPSRVDSIVIVLVRIPAQVDGGLADVDKFAELDVSAAADDPADQELFEVDLGGIDSDLTWI